MSAGATQLAFAAEFTLFLAALAGFAVVAIRTDLVAADQWSRAALSAGFIGLAAAAFLHGSLLSEEGSAAVVVPRVVGLALLLLGSLGAREDPGARNWLWAGAALLSVAELAVIAGGEGNHGVIGAARVLGAAAIGGALVGATRRSIPARVAASAAGTVLVVVLAVSVTLSAVVVDNVQEEALARVNTRAEAEAGFVGLAQTLASGNANVAALALSGSQDERVTGPLVTLATDPASPEGVAAAASVQSTLERLATLLGADQRLAFVPVGGEVVVDPGAADQQNLQVEISRTPLVLAALEQRRQEVAPAVVGGEAVAAAVAPVSLSLPRPLFVGVVYASEPLDDAYLEARSSLDEDVALALADGFRIYSRSPGFRGDDAVLDLAGDVLDGTAGSGRSVEDRFLSGAPVLAGERPVLALVTSAPTSLVDDTRESLFRTLFLVALGAALLAILLAALVGERIGGALRRLTVTAGEIRAGNLSAEAGLERDDELGVLGTAFDQMSGSLRSMTADLRAAAADEARLRGRLEAVVAGMGEALMAVDGAGRVTDFNAAAEELFEVAAPAIRGEEVGSLAIVGPKGEDLTDRLRTPRLEPWTTTATIVQQDGTEVPVAASGGAVRGPEGEVAGGVVVLRDMRRERAVERMRTEFLSNISHELKTPLTPIKGYAGIMVHRKLTVPQARRFAEDILVGAAQLERVIGQLVNFATVASGQVELRTEPIPVRSILEEVEKRWAARLPETHSVTVKVARGTPSVLADRRYLHLALDELVDNARKYTPEGGAIDLRARPSADGEHVELMVADRGVGIEAGAMGAIFGQFEQGDGSTTRAFGGLGLGLPFVQHIIDAHGGTLAVTSEPGRGTLVTVTIPSEATTGGASVPRRVRAATSRPRSRRSTDERQP
ncbi:MAG: ATP-binding protein [Acidimicrobiales bacterium]